MKNKTIISFLVLVMILSMSACNAAKDEDRVIIKEEGNEITIIEDNDDDVDESKISVKEIESYENVTIYDWLSEDTVIVSKENNLLEKMKLEELSDSYPRSLYLLNIDTKEYKLLKGEENLNLSDATLSPDRKHLIYTGNTLGDPTYFVMNLETLETFRIRDENNVPAWDASWADKDTIIGATYDGGIYLANTTGEMVALDDLQEEAIYIARKMKDKVYYNTNSNTTLMVLDLNTKEKKSLNIDNVYRVLPSPNENQMLILQDTGSQKSMILYDTDGGTMKNIDKGTELNGVSWSFDQRMIAYYKKTVEHGSSLDSLYIYDILTSENIQIVVDVHDLSTSWSPSGSKLAYYQWDGAGSSIISLKDIKVN